jgi:hypothetical protein
MHAAAFQDYFVYHKCFNQERKYLTICLARRLLNILYIYILYTTYIYILLYITIYYMFTYINVLLDMRAIHQSP